MLCRIAACLIGVGRRDHAAFLGVGWPVSYSYLWMVNFLIIRHEDVGLILVYWLLLDGKSDGVVQLSDVVVAMRAPATSCHHHRHPIFCWCSCTTTLQLHCAVVAVLSGRPPSSLQDKLPLCSSLLSPLYWIMLTGAISTTTSLFSATASLRSALRPSTPSTIKATNIDSSAVQPLPVSTSVFVVSSTHRHLPTPPSQLHPVSCLTLPWGLDL